MTLKEALGLKNEGMLSLIGAGGKTTTLFCLADELFREGSRVLVTTTTKIFKPTKPHVHKLYLFLINNQMNIIGFFDEIQPNHHINDVLEILSDVNGYLDLTRDRISTTEESL